MVFVDKSSLGDQIEVLSWLLSPKTSLHDPYRALHDPCRVGCIVQHLVGHIACRAPDPWPMMGYYRSPPGSVAVDASQCSKQLSEQATLMPANIKSNTVGEGGGQKWMINQTG